MRRYIDADAVLELIQEEFHKTDVNGEEQIGVLKCHRIVREAPTADVVEVVRCKDCIHREETSLKEIPKEVCWCGKLGSMAHDKHFCSYGERREG